MWMKRIEMVPIFALLLSLWAPGTGRGAEGVVPAPAPPPAKPTSKAPVQKPSGPTNAPA